MYAIPRNFESHDWITLILVGVLLFLVFVKNRYPYKLYNFSRILSTPKYFTESHKSLSGSGLFEFSLFIIQILLTALGLYFLTVGLEIAQGGLLLYVKIFLIYGVFMGGKYYFEKIIGVIFSIERFLNTYLFFKVAYKNFLALCLFPLLLILTYFWKGSEFFYKVIFILFVAVNLLSISKFYKKRKPEISQNLFYFILYLCTIEIVPYFILYKIIV